MNKDLSPRVAPRAGAQRHEAGRVAVLATHWLGDTFWALQIVPFLRRRFPGAEVHLFVRPGLEWLAGLWASCPEVHPVSSLRSDRRREGSTRARALLGDLRAVRREARAIRAGVGPLELCVDLSGTALSALLIRLLKPRVAIGAGSHRWLAGIYDVWQPSPAFHSHLAQRPWWVLSPLFGRADDWPEEEEQMRPRLPEGVAAAPCGGAAGGAAGAAASAAALARPSPVPSLDGDRPRILLFPGAGWAQKRWPLEHFTELAAALQADGWEVALRFAPAEAVLMEEARRLLGTGREDGALAGRACGGHQPPTIACEAGGGAALLAALAAARAVVSNDSGAAHLAAALGIPTVALFGPTNPRICGPLGPRVRVLRAACRERPEGEQHHCHDTPAFDCRREGLRSLRVAEVRAALAALLRDAEVGCGS